MDDKKYIYNPAQASFYINNGAKVLDTGIHHKTKKIFWVFDYFDTEKVYLLWLEKCRCKKCHL